MSDCGSLERQSIGRMLDSGEEAGCRCGLAVNWVLVTRQSSHVASSAASEAAGTCPSASVGVSSSIGVVGVRVHPNMRNNGDLANETVYIVHLDQCVNDLVSHSAIHLVNAPVLLGCTRKISLICICELQPIV